MIQKNECPILVKQVPFTESRSPLFISYNIPTYY